MKTSLVFDIQRFSTHDGKGIRTTIFFKGCPLHCLWCQNPEGLSPNRQVLYFENNCIHCRLCDLNKLENQMHYLDRPFIHHDYQGNFDNLVDVCPANALRYDSQPYSVDELLEEILKDQVFYRKEGGVTFSGGEPFLQGDFLIELLKKCKEKHINTAIESSFYAPLDLIKKALPYLDQIYCDFKVDDDKKHLSLTGVSNRLIKENIRFLLQSKYKDKVIIRTPLIPTMTGDKDNILAISHYIKSIYPGVKHELLNYNALAASKYDLLSLDYPLDKSIKPYSQEEMKHFNDLIK